MKKFAALLLILGILAIGAGQGSVYVKNNNKYCQSLNGSLVLALGEGLTPQLTRKALSTGIVSDLLDDGQAVTLDSFLKHGVTVSAKAFGVTISQQTITLQNLLNRNIPDYQVTLLRIGAWCYGYSLYLTIGGGVCILLAIIILFMQPTAKRSRR